MGNARVLVVVLMASLVCVSSSRAQNAPLIVGTWKLNREKSQLPPAPAGAFDIRQYTLRADGYRNPD